MKIHTINLARRTDRWERLQRVQAETPGVEFVRAPAPEMPGRAWLACAYSHQLAVFEAKNRNDPYVIVAEDDVTFTPHFSPQEFERLIAEAEAHEFGALYTGTVSFAEEIVSEQRCGAVSIAETTTYLSSQLTCYTRAGYDAVLHWPVGWGSDYGRNPLIGSDPTGRMAMTAPVYMKRGLTVPFLSIQDDSYSDNCGQYLNLGPTWKNAEQSWHNALRLGSHRVA